MRIATWTLMIALAFPLAGCSELAGAGNGANSERGLDRGGQDKKGGDDKDWDKEDWDECGDKEDWDECDDWDDKDECDDWDDKDEWDCDDEEDFECDQDDWDEVEPFEACLDLSFQCFDLGLSEDTCLGVLDECLDVNTDDEDEPAP